MSSLESTLIRKHFTYWLMHCALNASPSFAIAGAFLRFLDHPSTALAMLAGVFTFVLLYTAFTGYVMQIVEPNQTLRRALKADIKFRVVISIWSLAGLVSLGIFSPDFWAGMLAVRAYNMLTFLPKFPDFGRSTTLLDPDWGQFFPVYCVTIIEGLILSFTLFMVSFFAVLVIQAKERRKAYEETTMPPG